MPYCQIGKKNSAIQRAHLDKAVYTSVLIINKGHMDLDDFETTQEDIYGAKHGRSLGLYNIEIYSVFNTFMYFLLPQ